MPIILAVVLIIGVFLTGGALQERVQQPQPPTPTPLQEVQVPTLPQLLNQLQPPNQLLRVST